MIPKQASPLDRLLTCPRTVNMSNQNETEMNSELTISGLTTMTEANSVANCKGYCVHASFLFLFPFLLIIYCYYLLIYCYLCFCWLLLYFCFFSAGDQSNFQCLFSLSPFSSIFLSSPSVNSPPNFSFLLLFLSCHLVPL